MPATRIVEFQEYFFAVCNHAILECDRRMDGTADAVSRYAFSRADVR